MNMSIPSFLDIIARYKSDVDGFFIPPTENEGGFARKRLYDDIFKDHKFISSGQVDMRDYCEIEGFISISGPIMQIVMDFDFSKPQSTAATASGQQVLALSDETVNKWFEYAKGWIRDNLFRTGENQETVCILQSSEYNVTTIVGERQSTRMSFVHLQNDLSLRVEVMRTMPTQKEDGFRQISIAARWEERDAAQRFRMKYRLLYRFFTPEMYDEFKFIDHSTIPGIYSSPLFRSVKWTTMGWKKMQENFLAFSMGQHSRLGQNSGARNLHKDNVMTITSGNHNLLDCQYVFEFLDAWHKKGRDALIQFPLVDAYPGACERTGMACRACGKLIHFGSRLRIDRAAAV